MMKISDLELFLLSLPVSGEFTSSPTLLVRLIADSGQEGWGETPTSWRFEELSDRRDLLLTTLVGRSVYEIEDLLCLDILVANRELAAALEIASWDLIGHATNQPLYHLLGGGYRRHIPLAARLPATDAESLEKLSREYLEHGYHAQTLTASGVLEEDLERVQAWREASSGRCELRLDCQGFYDFETARQLVKKLQSAGLQFLIDPLAHTDLDSLASLRQQTSIPIAVSKSVTSAQDIIRLRQQDCVDHVSLNPVALGGIAATRRCAAVAEAANISVSLQGPTSAGPAIAAMMQLAACTPNIEGSNESGDLTPRDDLLQEPLTTTDGLLVVPESPGLGIEMDRVRIEEQQRE